MNRTREDVVAAVRRLLAREGRRNEYRVALVRVFAYSLVTVIDVLLWAAGMRPLGNLVLPVILIGAAGALVLIVRRWYRRWFAYAIPVLDAVFIIEMVTSRFERGGVTASLIATAALACGLFAATGSIRFEPRAAAWTTGLALVMLWILIGTRAETSGMLYAVVALLAIGMLNLWLSDLVRRSLEGVRGRMMLERFLQRSVVEHAFTDPEALIAAPKTVDATVLVSDLRGFTALSERLAPTEVLELLSEVHGALAEVVQRHGGIVDKFMGDGMLAVFGAPEPMRDHAARAVAAAHDLRGALAAVNARHPDRVPLKIGVGLHSGSLIAGVLGSGDRLEFTIIGDTVNTASRLEALTKEHGVEVLISGATADRIPGHGLASLGESSLRGRTERVALYTL